MQNKDHLLLPADPGALEVAFNYFSSAWLELADLELVLVLDTVTHQGQVAPYLIEFLIDGGPELTRKVLGVLSGLFLEAVGEGI